MKTQKVKEHYDLASPYYQSLWGNHIHHGYYITGKESKEEAADNLTNFIFTKSGIKNNSSILDVGCGIGGTSIWFAKTHSCKVNGITISPVQVKMANELASRENLKICPRFFLDDANKIKIRKKYDAIWAVEMISHLENKKHLFESSAKALNKGGKLVIADWFLGDFRDKYVDLVEKGMLVSMLKAEDYISMIEKAGLKLIYQRNITREVEKTWSVCLGLVKKKQFWNLARESGKEFITFLRSFNAMKNSYKSGSLQYQVLVFQK